MIFFLTEKGKFGENLRVFMNGKDGYKLTLEAATRSDILYLFGQGNLIFIRKKSAKSQGILKSEVCETMMFVSFSFSLATAFDLLKIPCNRAWSLIVNDSTPSLVSFSSGLPIVNIVDFFLV